MIEWIEMKDMTLENILRRVHEQIEQRAAFVLFKKPDVNQIKAVFLKQGAEESFDFQEDAGFVMRPFLDPKGSVFFPYRAAEVWEVPWRPKPRSTSNLRVGLWGL